MTVGKLCQRGSTYVDETKELPFQKIRASEEDDEYVAVASKRFQGKVPMTVMNIF